MRPKRAWDLLFVFGDGLAGRKESGNQAKGSH